MPQNELPQQEAPDAKKEVSVEADHHPYRVVKFGQPNMVPPPDVVEDNSQLKKSPEIKKNIEVTDLAALREQLAAEPGQEGQGSALGQKAGEQNSVQQTSLEPPKQGLWNKFKKFIAVSSAATALMSAEQATAGQKPEVINPPVSRMSDIKTEATQDKIETNDPNAALALAIARSKGYSGEPKKLLYGMQGDVMVSINIDGNEIPFGIKDYAAAKKMVEAKVGKTGAPSAPAIYKYEEQKNWGTSTNKTPKLNIDGMPGANLDSSAQKPGVKITKPDLVEDLTGKNLTAAKIQQQAQQQGPAMPGTYTIRQNWDNQRYQ